MGYQQLITDEANMDADYYSLKDIPSSIFLLSLDPSNISQWLCFLEYQEWYTMLMILDSKDFGGGNMYSKGLTSFDTQSTQKKN